MDVGHVVRETTHLLKDESSKKIYKDHTNPLRDVRNWIFLWNPLIWPVITLDTYKYYTKYRKKI